MTESKTAHSKGFMTFCGLYLGMQQWKAEFIIKTVKFKRKFNYANDILCDCEFAPIDLTEAYKDYPSTEFNAWTETLVEIYALPESAYSYVNVISELGFGWDSVFKVMWGDSILYIQTFAQE